MLLFDESGRLVRKTNLHKRVKRVKSEKKEKITRKRPIKNHVYQFIHDNMGLVFVNAINRKEAINIFATWYASEGMTNTIEQAKELISDCEIKLSSQEKCDRLLSSEPGMCL